MGVLGFAPFLQKQFPEVFRELPQRLRSLSGKTLAIDGTLITQRLHFAPIPCANRHILGWYRLIRELKECGVGIICVFDGEKRSYAKQRETERRRKLQRMDLARGAMEIERSRRLRLLTRLLKQYRTLPNDVKDLTAQALQDLSFSSRHQRQVRESLMGSVLQIDSDVSPPADGTIKDPSARGAELERPSDGQTFSPASYTQTSDRQGQLEDSLRLDVNVPTQNTGMYRREFKDLDEYLPEYFTSPEVSHKGALEKENELGHTTDVLPTIEQEKLTSEVITEGFYSGRPEQSSQAFVTPSSEAPTVDSSAELSECGKIAPRSIQYIAGDTDDVLSPNFRSRKFLESNEDSGVPPSIAPEDERRINVSSMESSVKLRHEYSAENISPLLARKSQDFLEPIIHPESNIGIDKNIAMHGEDPSLLDAEAEPSAEIISQGLLSLYQDYQDSVPTFMSSPIMDPSPDIVSSEEVSMQEQIMMSRSQIQLTLDEGNLWEELVRPSAITSEGNFSIEQLESLARKSDIISRSYERRNNPPTPRTYEECRLILRAMGVPCIDTAGPYEAEALAASLVHHGFADYVASEDTDVLVYEVPLLRNLTNSQSPLILLSGAEVREVLQLDRASYVDFALLLGTDFSQRIKNLGPHRAIKYIRTYRRIEQLIANEPKFVPRPSPDVYLKQVEVARLVFETLPPVPDPWTFQPTESDDDAVVMILERFGVYRAAAVEWDFGSALDGNYFGDNPAM